MNEMENETWVIGVSGGADSMSLLDMCVKANVNVIVAHVNYQKRNTANRDMLGVQEYCRNNNVPCFVLCVETYKEKENFQSQARTIRYEFYKQLINEHDACGVLVAHHMDDVIETYEMQQRRSSDVDYYGIQEEVMIYGVKVKRALLSYTKEEIIEYCKNNHVIYYDDESNFTLDYTRNKIRHEYISTLSKEDKLKIIDEIKEKNEQKETINSKIKVLLDVHPHTIIKEEYITLSNQEQLLYLRKWIEKECDKYTCSMSEIKDIHLKFTHTSQHFVHNINHDKYIIEEYGLLKVEDIRKENYAYTFDSLDTFTCEYFRLEKQGKVIERFSVNEEDFPITIRNYQESDKIKLRMGSKKVSRFLIDRKIPKKIRETWPVVVNKDKEVIFVYGIGCDIAHFSNNYFIFMLK